MATGRAMTMNCLMAPVLSCFQGVERCPQTRPVSPAPGKWRFQARFEDLAANRQPILSPRAFAFVLRSRKLRQARLVRAGLCSDPDRRTRRAPATPSPSPPPCRHGRAAARSARGCGRSDSRGCAGRWALERDGASWQRSQSPEIHPLRHGTLLSLLSRPSCYRPTGDDERSLILAMTLSAAGRAPSQLLARAARSTSGSCSWMGRK